jgi:opacity protein-like surface antigen
MVAGLVFLTFSPAVHGQGFYAGGNAGLALGEDVRIDRFIVRTPGTQFELHPGGRLSIFGGYNFNDFVGAQIETGFIYNDIDQIKGGGSIDGALMHVPLLADIVLRYDRPNFAWVPYVGIGGGGDVSEVWLDHVRAPNGSIVDGVGSDVVFAWQAFAGLRYKFAENMSIGAGYKFFWADGASWDVEHTPSSIDSGTARVHSILVDFTWKF